MLAGIGHDRVQPQLARTVVRRSALTQFQVLNPMEETRRRVQQEQLGYRGHKNDLLYRIRNATRAGTEKLTERQIDRIDAGL